MSTVDKPAGKKYSNSRQRKLTLRCRALPTEAEQIRKLAEDLGLSVSEVLREAALGTKIRRPRKPLPSLDRQALAHLTGQLGKVGSNLNQIARHANGGHGLGDHESLAATVVHCRKLIEQLAKLLA
ncbi:plasmid mobilization protein [Thauera aminoaromatica]|uniref:plasmid mobilization protein n=1 Tax=Thauera aminoaromatica TaxID=164330 RepID=UPI0035B3CEC2